MPIVKTTHVIYTVQPGDTLFSLAARYGSSVEQIERINALYPPITDPGHIYPGQVILIPTSVTQPFQILYVISPGDTLYRIARRFSEEVDLLIGVNRGITDPNLIFPGMSIWVPAFIYEIVPGDSLNAISRRFNIPLAEILRANENRPGLSPDVIYPGYRLLLPLPSSVNIVVLNPQPGDFIQSGQRIEGFARVFEANVLYQVRDDNNRVVARERFTTAFQGAPAYGYFSARLTFDQPPTTRGGELWVYARSPRDGSIIDLVQVRVYFVRETARKKEEASQADGIGALPETIQEQTVPV